MDSFSESFKVSISVSVALQDFNFVVTPYIFEMLYLILFFKIFNWNSNARDV